MQHLPVRHDLTAVMKSLECLVDFVMPFIGQKYFLKNAKKSSRYTHKLKTPPFFDKTKEPKTSRQDHDHIDEEHAETKRGIEYLVNFKKNVFVCLAYGGSGRKGKERHKSCKKTDTQN